jgi:hypothetical protein
MKTVAAAGGRVGLRRSLQFYSMDLSAEGAIFPMVYAQAERAWAETRARPAANACRSSLSTARAAID